jgi:hypothetical protein
MEADDALKSPPPLLERLVLSLIPPAARETVAGDLCELYRSPSHYVASAAAVLPFVVASQIRRNLNLPVLFVQGAIVFLCCEGILNSGRDPATLSHAAALTAAFLSIFLIVGAYRSDGPPAAKRAILEAIAVSASVMTYAFLVISGLRASHHLVTHQIGYTLFSWLILPFGMPVLSGLRAAMIVAREKREHNLAGEMSPRELVLQYAHFESRSGRRNRTDIGFLLAAAAALAGFQLHFAPPFGAFASGIVIVYLVAAAYLSLHGAPRKLPPNADFLSLRTTYRQELARQHQLRSFILWLWPAPVLFIFYGSTPGAFMLASMPMVYATIAAVFLSFLVAAANRERDGHVQELTGLLCRMRERRTL